MDKTLILIRHGHRDNSRREIDNGLSEKGKEQAKCLRRFAANRFNPEDFNRGIWIVSSPKLRCRETLEPLAKSLERRVDSHPDLDEQDLREPQSVFDQRIQRFLNEWIHSQSALTFACSHGDWLPMAVHKLLGFSHEFKKGSWLEVEWLGGAAALRWYIPSFRTLFK